MSLAFKNKKRYTKRINDLYLKLDSNKNGTISLNEYFELIDIMEGNEQWHIPLFGDLEIWIKIRAYLN